MLVNLTRSGRTSVRLAQRVRIVLLANEGMQNKAIAIALNLGRAQVGRWRERYAKSRLAGIKRDLPRGAPARKVDDARRVDLSAQGVAPKASHWSTLERFALRCKVGCAPRTGALATVSVRGAPLQGA